MAIESFCAFRHPWGVKAFFTMTTNIANWLYSGQAHLAVKGIDQPPRLSQSDYMMAKNPNRIADVRKRQGLSQQDLAERVGAHWVTISKLERGQMKLTFEWLTKLARAMQVDIYDLYSEEEMKRIIKIEGLVLPKGRIKMLDEYSGFKSFTAVAPSYEGDDGYWLYVDTDDFYPFLQNGDLVRAMKTNIASLPDLVNRLCFVQTSDAPPEYFMGVLTPGAASGRYDLAALSGPPIRDIQIGAVSRVSSVHFTPSAGGNPDYHEHHRAQRRPI